MEVLKDDNIHKCYFEIPLLCNFMTDNIRNHVIFKANRNSDQERIKQFFSNLTFYAEEMRLREKIAKHNKIKNMMVNNWRKIHSLNYWFVLVVIFLIQVMSYYKFLPEDKTTWVRYDHIIGSYKTKMKTVVTSAPGVLPKTTKSVAY